MTIERHNCETRMSQAVSYGGLVYFSALAATDLNSDIETQTANVLQLIDRVLAETGTDKTKLVQATIWLATISDYAKMNSVWDNWVPRGCAPARSCAETKFSTPDILIEISGIGAR
jgi:enamine deaminase RidA (YjgF/YER057c/UK114 family)